MAFDLCPVNINNSPVIQAQMGMYCELGKVIGYVDDRSEVIGMAGGQLAICYAWIVKSGSNERQNLGIGFVRQQTRPTRPARIIKVSTHPQQTVQVACLLVFPSLPEAHQVHRYV